MDAFLDIMLIAGAFISSYIVSLYSLAVYLDPDELTRLFPGVGGRRRNYMAELASDPRALTQIATVYKSFSLVLVTILTVLLMRWVSSKMQTNPNYLLPAGVLLVWMLYLLFVEYLPRRSSRRDISSFFPRYMWLVTIIYVLFMPVIGLYRRAIREVKQEHMATEDEKEEIVERAIESLADDAGIGETIVKEEEKQMIGQIFLLDQTVVREIMVPRMDIVGIERSMPFRDLQEFIRDDGHSRFPVYEGTIDRVIGILYVKDLFARMPAPGESFVIDAYLRKPYFVPESKIIGELLREFKLKKLHIAIVVDEYGGVAGLVTLEDVLEEIVGEIQDEHDVEEAEITRLPDGRYSVDGGLLVKDLQNHLGTDYEQGDYDTVGGLIYDLVGSVPKEGVKVGWNDYEFTIDALEGQRIKRVRVARRQDATL
jgi:CBS domain containing-hemolysin-like protein